MSELKVGDVVRRKDVPATPDSSITIQSIDDDRMRVWGVWREGDEINRGRFLLSELVSYPEGERVQEFMTMRNPATFPSFKRAFWSAWADKAIVIHCKNNVIILGTFEDFQAGFLLVNNATIKGKRTVHVKRVQVDRDAISHFHEPVETKPETISVKDGV